VLKYAHKSVMLVVSKSVQGCILIVVHNARVRQVRSLCFVAVKCVEAVASTGWHRVPHVDVCH
jgi:hypothetical protein